MRGRLGDYSYVGVDVAIDKVDVVYISDSIVDVADQLLNDTIELVISQGTQHGADRTSHDGDRADGLREMHFE